ncbi:hypothetical protein OOT46_26140 [Aquabacterium sp. A7-Y]|uniref:hypothetical protein n=1 Tax=Aquabacterium sp. A7-Y TaxID=1349605 RepID=UPI00223D9B3A|nr:hypothetical protein [Aquabacterium sp. A7-Y]MCW7541295.1 hypothetical protein [Aquabacterium sp. A7-Y]
MTFVFSRPASHAAGARPAPCIRYNPWATFAWNRSTQGRQRVDLCDQGIARKPIHVEVNVFRKVAQTGATILTGVAIDRMSQQPREAAPTPRPTAPLRRGDEVLGGLAQRARLGSEAPNPLVHGGLSQIENRRNAADKLMTIARNPERAAEHAARMVDDVKSDVQFVQGAVKIAQGGQLTTGDGVRLAKAAAQSTENSVVAAARGLYAGVTTSQAGVDDFAKSVSERVTYEGQSVAAGVAASQTLAAAVGMIPHPAAKIGAAAIRISGQVAAGSKASEAVRELGGQVEGPVRKEIVAIAKEKSQDG